MLQKGDKNVFKITMKLYTKWVPSSNKIETNAFSDEQYDNY